MPAEWKYDWGGHKEKGRIPFHKLPFHCCAIAFTPFEDAVGGQAFNLAIGWTLEARAETIGDAFRLGHMLLSDGQLLVDCTMHIVYLAFLFGC